MTYSGLVADPSAGFSPRGPYPMRLIAFTLLSGAIGWVFTAYMPQIPDLAWRFALGFGMAITLIMLTTNVSYSRGERMFAALCFGAAFIAGMWGPWAFALFGDIPTLDQVRAQAAGRVYDAQIFGEPFQVRGYIFEMWAGLTALMASVPLFASLAKPVPPGAWKNPFDVSLKYADPFVPKLIFLPMLSFAIAAGAVYLAPYAVAYEIPMHVVWLPPIAAAFIYAKLHMRFVQALIVSLVGGIGGAAGFWLPWLYMTSGQDGMIAFLQGTPQDILARAQEAATGYTYVTDIYGTVSDYSPWAFEIWAGLTLAYLCLPVLVTLLRRLSYFVRLR